MQGQDLLSASNALQEFERDVDCGMSSKPQKYLHPKYFYDEAGSRLFEQICFQKEYYLTRTEAQILKDNSSEIIRLAHNGSDRINIIELGSGTSAKTRILFRYLLSEQSKQVFYYPIDISDTALLETTNMLSGDFPNLHIKEIIADYKVGLGEACALVHQDAREMNKIILFLGSSIGNLGPEEAVSFLRMLRSKMLERDSLLVGFDLEKDVETLEAAYNDKAGITAKFNLNVLGRINRELGGRFDLSLFDHFSFYNKNAHRIEMRLVSKKNQSVHVDALGKKFDFLAGETIHTENSHKYSVRRIEILVRQCGLAVKKHFMDDNRWFDLCLLAPA